MWLSLLLGGPDFNHLFKGIRIHIGNYNMIIRN